MTHCAILILFVMVLAMSGYAGWACRKVDALEYENARLRRELGKANGDL